MKQIWILVTKELKDYFISSIAYVVGVLFLVGVGAYFAANIFVENEASMRSIFTIMPIIGIVVIPAITMRSWAEELKEGTLEVLMTEPINTWQLFISKFFSAYLFSLILLLLTFPLPVIVNILGKPDNGIIIAGYLGSALMFAALVALGQLISINTKNQITSFLLAFTLAGALYLLGEQQFLQLLPLNLREYSELLSLKSHFESVAKGVIDTRDIVYFVSMICTAFIGIYLSLIRIKNKGV